MLDSARTAATDPCRAVRRASARQRLDGIPARADRYRKAAAVGAGADGDPRERAGPSPRPSFARPHPCRGSRCAPRPVGNGGGPKMLRPLGGDRGDLGRSQGARLHRDSATGSGVGAERGGMLACPARRRSEPEWCAHALAGRERAVAGERIRCAGAGAAGMECRAVPRARNSAGTMEPRP